MINSRAGDALRSVCRLIEGVQQVVRSRSVGPGQAVYPVGVSGDMSMSWSPDTSLYPTERERLIAESKLTLSGQRLAWSPRGIRSSVTSRPFSVAVGSGDDQVAEAVWVKGTLMYGRYNAIRVDLIALCAKAPDTDGRRRVLGYLPTVLFQPKSVQFSNGAEHDDAVRARLAAFAQSAGLTASLYKVRYGSNVSRVFPGALAGGGGALVPVFARLIPLAFTAVAIYIPAAAFGDHHQPTGWRIAAFAGGLVFLALAIVQWPAFVNARRFRREPRSSRLR